MHGQNSVCRWGPFQRHLSEWSNFQRPEYTDHIRDGYEPEVIRDKLLELGFVISEMRLTFRDLGIVAADICEIFDGRTSIGVLSIRLIAHPILALFALLDGIIVRRTGNGIFIDALKIAQHKCDFPSQRSTASSGGQSES